MRGHTDSARAAQGTAPRLLDFERDGDLTMVDRPGEDVCQVADIVCRIHAASLLPEKMAIGVDATSATSWTS